MSAPHKKLVSGANAFVVRRGVSLIPLNSTDKRTIGNPMGYTIGDAAKATGKTKSTISKAIKNGRISALRKETGEYDIDPAELHRVYPPVSSEQDNASLTGEREETEKIIRIKELEGQLETVRKESSMLRDQLHDLKQDRDHWRQQATALLTDQRPRFWSRLFRFKA